MEQYRKYEFSGRELEISDMYIGALEEERNKGSSSKTASRAAARSVLSAIVNSRENIQTYGGYYRWVQAIINEGVPERVMQMYEEAHADHELFSLDRSAA